jgi:hypothetical protein
MVGAELHGWKFFRKTISVASIFKVDYEEEHQMRISPHHRAFQPRVRHSGPL